MFDRDQRFVVISNTLEPDGRRFIELGDVPRFGPAPPAESPHGFPGS